MKPGIENHPALRLGKFLKDQRIGANLTLREAARKLGVMSSVLSELELGIGDHFSEQMADRMQDCYQIDDEWYIIEQLCEELSRSNVLSIGDIYYEEDLLPALFKLTDEERKKLLTMLGFKHMEL